MSVIVWILRVHQWLTQWRSQNNNVQWLNFWEMTDHIHGFCPHRWIGPLMNLHLDGQLGGVGSLRRECILEGCLWGPCLVPGPFFSSSLISDFWPGGGKQLCDSPWCCALSWCRSNITTQPLAWASKITKQNKSFSFKLISALCPSVLPQEAEQHAFSLFRWHLTFHTPKPPPSSTRTMFPGDSFAQVKGTALLHLPCVLELTFLN